MKKYTLIIIIILIAFTGKAQNEASTNFTKKSNSKYNGGKMPSSVCLFIGTFMLKQPESGMEKRIMVSG